ncbi:MAG: hypothetical protein WA666_12665 [Nitrospirota bacterium]
MKLLSLLMLSALLAVMPAVTFAADAAKNKDKPPVSQTLVREGDYAVRLAETLKLGKMSEIQAESKLASLGIAPLSGWISDFPVTPDIVAEIHSAVKKSAEDKKLSMNSKKAGEALDKLNASMKLPVKAAQGENPPNGYESWQESSQYGNGPDEYPPTIINNYYYDEGPPVVTYYPPPYDYDYLYAWDPFPFWWGGVWFPGFFILTDFDCVVGVDEGGIAVFGGHEGFHHRRFATRTLSNHIVDPKTNAVTAINPVTRTLPATLAQTIPGTRTTLADRTIQTRRLAALKTSVAPTGSRTGTGGTTLQKSGIASGGTRRFDATRARSIYQRSVASARPSVSTGGRGSFGGSRQAGPATGGTHFNPAPSLEGIHPNTGRGGGGGFSGGHGGRSSNPAPSLYGGPEPGFSNSGRSGESRSSSQGSRSFSGAEPSGGHSFSGGVGGFSGGGRSFGGRSFGGGCRGRC